MATEQVMQWINRDIRLSKVIHSFETDFSNGYLFGEILCQSGVYEDLTMFSKKSNKESKVNNFYLIEDALRHLKVRFDGKLTHNIMQEERGAALRLLYQLKLAIQKRDGPPPDAMEAETMTGLKQGTVNKKLQQTFEKTINLAGTIPPKTIGGKDVRTQKQKRQDAHLIKFDVAMKNNFDNALAQDSNERALVNKIQQTKRADNRRKVRENQEFMKEWEEEGRFNWEENRQKRADNIARQKYFEDREVGMYKARLTKELNEATAEMHNGVSDFDKNLQKLGIDQNINMEDAMKRMEEKQGIPPGQIQNFSFPATMNKIKETKKQSDFAGKERERRRRKLAVDQANTQARLDTQKEEDNLIQKLMNQQQEEQQQAYADERLRKCKQMLFDHRQAKANEVARQRQAKYQEMEQQSKLESKGREVDRQKMIERQKLDYALIHKETKMAKRRVNIEIASGIVDLITDLSEEVFQVTQNQHGKKLNKAQWREFSNIFVEGKKVSLRNITKTIVDTDSVQKGEEDGALHVSASTTAVQILTRFNKEPALHDMFQFISNSGLFNLDQLKPELMQHWCEQLNIQKFVSQGNGLLVSNEDLGKMIKNLYENQINNTFQAGGIMKIQDQFNEQIKEEAEDGEDAVIKIPKELPLKLAILGRCFSGKKTIASQIQEKLGGDKNIKLFNMDEIIKEALDYITPKKVDEAALEAAKKAKKGKQEEVVNVDIFEGKTVSEYKKIANQIKSQYFADYEGDNLPQTHDLANLIFDDALLVNIFVERLKVEYEGVELTVSRQELEAGISREKEITAQLSEMDDSTVTADPKGKGKGGKGGGKAPDEALKEELESIRSVNPKGWILIDFPRNLTQMKLLESSLSGYECLADLPKNSAQEKYEIWTQVATPPYLISDEATGEVCAETSGFDGVIILDTPDSECQRRAEGRKIDPTTQIVYHMTTNPPEDAKVLERLQEYTDAAGNPERMQKVTTGFNQSISAIKLWLTKFGLSNAEGVCEVQLDMEIKLEPKKQPAPPVKVEGSTIESENQAEPPAPIDPWTQKNDVFDAVLKKVRQVKDYHQAEWNIQRERVAKEVEERERLEQEAKAKAEEEQKAEEERKQKLEEEKKAQASIAKSQDSADEGGQKDEVAEVSKTLDSKKSNKPQSIEISNADGNASEEHIPEAMKTVSSSKRLLSENLQHSVGGTSKSIGRSTKFMQRIQELSERQKIAKWEDMLVEYYREGMQEFNALRNMRQRVCRSLNETQRKFISYLGRYQKVQQFKINEYCENYNRFSREFPDLIGNQETRKELLSRVDVLNKQLWESIQTRKEESMNERLSYMEGGWVQLEMVKLCSSIAKLIELEFKRFFTISAIVTSHIINEEVDLQEQIKKLTERGVDPYLENTEDRTQVGNSPLLLEVAQTILGKVESLFNEQFVLSLDAKISKLLNIERQNFSKRLNSLFTWASLILHEISSQAFQVFDVLDDWVVIAVKRENQACQQAVRDITDSVGECSMHIETVILQGEDLDNLIDPIEFYEGPPQYMLESKPSFSLHQTRFTTDSLKMIYRQLKSNQQDGNLIDVQTFQSLMLINMQQGVLPNIWRFIPFDSIIILGQRLEAKPLSDNPNGNSQVKLFRRRSLSADGADLERNFMDWRKLFAILTIAAGQLPTNSDIQGYESRIRAQAAVSDDGLLPKDDFVKIPAWFDNIEATMTAMAVPTAISPVPSQLSPRSLSAAISASQDASARELAKLDISADGDDDDDGDQERLIFIKSLLYDTYRIQNRQGMMIDDYVNDLKFIFNEKRQNEDDQRTLYQTMLGMQD